MKQYPIYGTNGIVVQRRRWIGMIRWNWWSTIVILLLLFNLLLALTTELKIIIVANADDNSTRNTGSTRTGPIILPSGHNSNNTQSLYQPLREILVLQKQRQSSSSSSTTNENENNNNNNHREWNLRTSFDLYPSNLLKGNRPGGITKIGGTSSSTSTTTKSKPNNNNNNNNDSTVTETEQSKTNINNHKNNSDTDVFEEDIILVEDNNVTDKNETNKIKKKVSTTPTLPPAGMDGSDTIATKEKEEEDNTIVRSNNHPTATTNDTVPNDTNKQHAYQPNHNKNGYDKITANTNEKLMQLRKYDTGSNNRITPSKSKKMTKKEKKKEPKQEEESISTKKSKNEKGPKTLKKNEKGPKTFKKNEKGPKTLKKMLRQKYDRLHKGDEPDIGNDSNDKNLLKANDAVQYPTDKQPTTSDNINDTNDSNKPKELIPLKHNHDDNGSISTAAKTKSKGIANSDATIEKSTIPTTKTKIADSNENDISITTKGNLSKVASTKGFSKEITIQSDPKLQQSTKKKKKKKKKAKKSGRRKLYTQQNKLYETTTMTMTMTSTSTSTSARRINIIRSSSSSSLVISIPAFTTAGTTTLRGSRGNYNRGNNPKI